MKKILSLLIMALPLVANAQISNDDVHKYDHHNQSQYRTEINIPGLTATRLSNAISISTPFSQMVRYGLR